MIIYCSFLDGKVVDKNFLSFEIWYLYVKYLFVEYIGCDNDKVLFKCNYSIIFNEVMCYIGIVN